MRFLLAVVWCLALSACTSSAAIDVEEAAATPATTSPAGAETTTTTEPTPRSALRLSAAERLAVHGGVTIQVANEAGVELGRFDATTGFLPDVAPIGATLAFRYHAPDGTPTDVGWTQAIAGDPGWDEVEQPWRVDGDPGRVVLGWQVGSNSRALVRQLAAAPAVNVASPIWWHIAADGSLEDRSDPGYAASVGERGVAVWPAVQSFEPGAITALVEDAGGPQAAAVDLAARAEGSGVAGVNVDIEGYGTTEAELVVEFVAALTEAVHGWGGMVSVDVVPRSDTWDISPASYAFWSTAPRRRELAAASDFIILMAYDQHNRLRPAGPVADPAWVEEVLAYELRYSDPHQVILGLPMYGRIWDEDDLESPRAVGIGTIAAAGETGVVVDDPEFSVPRVDLDGGRFTWLEDYDAMAVRAGLVPTYGLSGWAAWRLGLDTPQAWEQLPE